MATTAHRIEQLDGLASRRARDRFANTHGDHLTRSELMLFGHLDERSAITVLELEDHALTRGEADLDRAVVGECGLADHGAALEDTVRRARTRAPCRAHAFAVHDEVLRFAEQLHRATTAQIAGEQREDQRRIRHVEDRVSVVVSGRGATEYELAPVVVEDARRRSVGEHGIDDRAVGIGDVQRLVRVRARI